MRRLRSVFVILLLLFDVFGVLPAVDVPETPYDESEALPYEGTPLFSIVAPQASGRIAESGSCASLSFNSSTECAKLRREKNALPGCVPVSFTILDHSFRC